MTNRTYTLFILLLSFPAQAMIPPAQTTLVLKGHEPIKEDSVMNQELAKQLIPTDMPATENSALVVNRFFDRGMKYILESDSMKKNTVVQKAQAIGDVMKTNVTLGDPHSPGIHHSFETQADIFQGVGKLHYSGYFSANVTVHNDGNFEVSMDRKIDSIRTLVLKHTSADDVSALQMSWNW